jgi:hypothetical protein
MKKVVIVMLVAFQGIGFAQDEEALDARAIMEEMKNKDLYGMFRQPVKREQFVEGKETQNPSPVQNSPLRRRQPELRTASEAQRRASPARKQTQIMVEYPTQGFRELKGYEKWLALQKFGGFQPVQSPPIYSCMSERPEGQRLFVGATREWDCAYSPPLKKGQVLKFLPNPHVITFGSISEVPLGGISVDTQYGRKFLRYNTSCALTPDGRACAIAIRTKQLEVQILYAEVVDFIGR